MCIGGHLRPNSKWAAYVYTTQLYRFRGRLDQDMELIRAVENFVVNCRTQHIKLEEIHIPPHYFDSMTWDEDVVGKFIAMPTPCGVVKLRPVHATEYLKQCKACVRFIRTQKVLLDQHNA